MILLDTNLISELWKASPDLRVLAWMDAQALETLFLSAVTVAELRFGVAALPEGRRRAVYQERLEREVLPLFAGRVLAFDLEASRLYAERMAGARLAGKGIGAADGYIAATAAAHGLLVATRDVGPFGAFGLKAVNPWNEKP